MKINRAVGIILFFALAHIVLGDVISAFSRALVAVLGTVEVASNAASVGIIQLH